jgi:hypothetical protein
MKKLIKNPFNSYDPSIRTNAVVYAYESAQQDATNTQGVNNLPADASTREENERRRRELERQHAEARRQVTIAAGSGLIAGSASRNSNITATGGIIGFLGGVAAHCQNCHK